MSTRAADRLLGAILMVFAALWCFVAITTIPALGGGEMRLGARGFPVALGAALGVLGLVVFSRTFVNNAPPPEATEAAPNRRIEIWAVSLTVGLLVTYTVLLKFTGFLIATFLVAAVGTVLVQRAMRPVLVISIAVGLSLGIYIVFGKLLGVYLPHGTIINLRF